MLAIDMPAPVPALLLLPPPAPAQIPAVSLPASLYANCGKLAVEITSLGRDCATVVASAAAEARPSAGSIAILVRNGIKVPALVAWGESESLDLRFEAPFLGDRCEEAFRG
jgi:hypothetical protein